MSDCIFCKVAAGEIPATLIYEDDHVVAFDDIAPQAPVHSLIIPRAHYRDLADDVPAEVLAALLGAVPRVAAAKGVDASGYRVIINTGEHASQTVKHLHVHLMGGAQMVHGMVTFAEGE